MNGYEVIKELNKVKTCSEHTNDVDKRDKAIEIAKESVQKQRIPKSIISDDSNMLFDRDGFCPVCHTKMIFDRLAHEKQRYSFCVKCGQLLDWGEF